MSENKFEFLSFQRETINMIIEAMDDESKMKFMFCSDECASNMSGNYITQIHVENSSKADARLRMRMKQANDTHDIYFSSLVAGGCIVTYKRSSSNSAIRKTIVDADWLDVLAKYFQKVIDSVTRIGTISINLPDFPMERTNIRHLRRIRRFIIEDGCCLDFASRFINLEQFSIITTSIESKINPLTYLQLRQMKATEIELRTDDMTSEDMNNYLKSFQNGQIHGNVLTVDILMYPDEHVFDISKVLDGVNVIGIVERDSDPIRLTFVLAVTTTKIVYACVMDCRVRITVHENKHASEDHRPIPIEAYIDY